MVKVILVAADGSDHARKAVKLAADLVQKNLNMSTWSIRRNEQGGWSIAC